MSGLLLIADAALCAALLNSFLKRLARLKAFRWLERRVYFFDFFPTPYRYVFVYLGALVMLVIIEALLK